MINFNKKENLIIIIKNYKEFNFFKKYVIKNIKFFELITTTNFFNYFENNKKKFKEIYIILKYNYNSEYFIFNYYNNNSNYMGESDNILNFLIYEKFINFKFVCINNYILKEKLKSIYD